MIITIILYIIAFALMLFGIVSLIISLPIISGPVFVYAGTIILAYIYDYNGLLSGNFLIFWGVLTILFSFLDNLLPLLGVTASVNRKKSCLFNFLGAGVGLLFGILLSIPFTAIFPIIGTMLALIIGPFIAYFIFALLAELHSGASYKQALKIGTITSALLLTAVLMKFLFCIILFGYNVFVCLYNLW